MTTVLEFLKDVIYTLSFTPRYDNLLLISVRLYINLSEIIINLSEIIINLSEIIVNLSGIIINLSEIILISVRLLLLISVRLY